MIEFGKLEALQYLVTNNPLCDNCARADLEEIRIAAGLYAVVRELLADTSTVFSKEDLDNRIRVASSF